MTVMMTNRSQMDPAAYDQVIAGLGRHRQVCDGFRGHFAGLAPDGSWTVTEIWDSAEQHAAWYDQNVRPHLPVGVEPQIYPLHNTLLPNTDESR